MATSRNIEVSEAFVSVQGEGASVGEPCAFLRLAGCNLRCRWCDTAYSWDFGRHERAAEVRTWSIEDAAHWVAETGQSRLVFTGGEPLLQQKSLIALLESLDSLTIEIETNGTVVPDTSLLSRVDQWNVSPKLANSGEPLARRLVPQALARLSDTNRAWLKLVVESDADLDEVAWLVSHVSWPTSRVLLMAQGASADELLAREQWLAEACVRQGYRLSPRLHVHLWRGARGK